MIQYLRAILFIFLFVPMVAQAQNFSDTDKNVILGLVSEKQLVSGGDEIWVGVHQKIRPDWHTYWKNPGDSGAAPIINWQLPEGFRVSEIYWPVPDKIPYPPLLNYGYEEEVTLLQALTIPNDIGDEPLTLRASVDILVCKETCVPESADIELVLNARESHPSNDFELIDTALKSLPKEGGSHAVFAEERGYLYLDSADIPYQAEDIEILPEEWGVLHNPAVAEVSVLAGREGQIVRQIRGERPLNGIEEAAFIIAYKQGGERHSVRVVAEKGDIDSSVFGDDNASALSFESGVPEQSFTVFSAIFAAFVGGLILNLMPCVFPILSMKALSLAKLSDRSLVVQRLNGIAYTAGIVLSFLMIALVLIALKAGGAEIGWGFQLQNPLVVGALIYIVFLVGLNLAGYFDIGGSFSNVGGGLAQKTGYAGSFYTGVLATLVATPCTAPFMAVAVGYALVQSWFVALVIFASLGLGLAFPFLALSFFPALGRKLPKPGDWMVTFKHFLAFPMFFAAIWLVWVLALQTDAYGVLKILAGMGALAFGIFMLTAPQRVKVLRIFIAALSFIVAVFLLFHIPQSKGEAGALQYESFSQTAYEEALATDQPVFVEMTAAWCITCKVNHVTSINVDSTKHAFSSNNAIYLLGDWTNQDENITKYLERYGRSGVPLYVFYGAPDVTGSRPAPKILPQVLTPNMITELFNITEEK